MVDLPGADPPDREGDPTTRRFWGEADVPSTNGLPPARGGEPALRPPSPGDRLNDYQIIGLLGAGGMGQVYRARHLRLDREAALKVIAANQVGPEAARRFEREMRAAGRASHANLVVATDAGEARGWLYLVMELVPGRDLAELVKRIGPLTVADACEIARQAALGLQASTRPAWSTATSSRPNLMLTPEGPSRFSTSAWRGWPARGATR